MLPGDLQKATCPEEDKINSVDKWLPQWMRHKKKKSKEYIFKALTEETIV